MKNLTQTQGLSKKPSQKLQNLQEGKIIKNSRKSKSFYHSLFQDIIKKRLSLFENIGSAIQNCIEKIGKTKLQNYIEENIGKS